jgi:hypothetical protein
MLASLSARWRHASLSPNNKLQGRNLPRKLLKDSVRYRTFVRNFRIMGRELVWLENSSFAAWGCKSCGWIMPPRKVSDKPPSIVKQAFNKHDCANFPRALSRKGTVKGDSCRS